MDKFKGFDEMLYRLIQVRNSVDRAKNQKLLIRWPKRGDYIKIPAGDIVDHIFEEFEEFAEAVDGPPDPPNGYGFKLRDEVVDIINCLEMLWDVLDLGRL